MGEEIESWVNAGDVRAFHVGREIDRASWIVWAELAHALATRVHRGGVGVQVPFVEVFRNSDRDACVSWIADVLEELR